MYVDERSFASSVLDESVGWMETLWCVCIYIFDRAVGDKRRGNPYYFLTM